MKAAALPLKASPPGDLIPARQYRNALRVLWKGFALLVAALAAVVLIVLFVPEQNDYSVASRKKHARLVVDRPRKIVFVGGSNLVFGLDSAAVERATGSHVVNMGMNGYFGVRFMLEEVKPWLRAPDVVVISLEYDNFFKSADGTAADLLIVAKGNPKTFGYLSWKQRSRVVSAAPFVAQQKLLRLIRDSFRGVHAKFGGVPQSEIPRIELIEAATGLNEYGDLTSHLDVEWPLELEQGLDLTNLPMNDDVLALLKDFAGEMNARGVGVLVSYTPATADYYAKHAQSIGRLHAVVSRSPPLLVPSPPAQFVFPQPWFFDTVYHLNRQGRTVRTERVVKDLTRYLSSR